MNASRRDRWITATLVLFCAVMTALLVRGEYYPDGSLLHRVPPDYVLRRFLKNESTSALRLVWKGEDAGSFTVRVIPGVQPTLTASLQAVAPVLGRRFPVQAELNCRLKNMHAVERLHLQGTEEGTRVELYADRVLDRVHLAARGEGVDETREYRWSELERAAGGDLAREIPGLPREMPAQAQQVEAALRSARLCASAVREKVRGEWVEAYLLEGRVDANIWFKLWMSATGELLRFDSGFGLRAVNREFYEGAGEISSS